MRKIVAAAIFRGKSTKNRKICNCVQSWTQVEEKHDKVQENMDQKSFCSGIYIDLYNTDLL